MATPQYDHDEYTSPFTDRYYTAKMSKLFSDDNKYSTWRWMWIWLASAQKRCGVNITDEQIEEMVLHVKDIPYNRVSELEAQTKHDVVAHLRAYAEQCPKAAPIIHLGATSCYVTDNTDVIVMRDAMKEIETQLKSVIGSLMDRAQQHKELPTVGRTHFQPAQPVSVGRRIAMWAQDFLMDLHNLKDQIDYLMPLGCRGATGTADSFLKLFNGNYTKVKQMEYHIVNNMGFQRAIDISGQTYTRKQDYYVMQVLSGIAQSACKMATDIRLVSGLGEMYESFGSGQVGSSAMPYKRNPITCEKICGLSRYVINLAQNAAWTAATQWLERSLDDSSNRRVVIPEIFMATSAILRYCEWVANNLTVDEDTIEKHITQFAENEVCEGIITAAVKKGKNRQTVHERLRVHYMSGKPLTSIAEDPDIGIDAKELSGIIMGYANSPCGAAAEQVASFVSRYKHEL